VKPRVVDDSARKLAQKLALRSGHSDQSSSRFGRSAAEPWGVKWCGCRFKVFALEYQGQHYCSCGYPIKSYAIYGMSPLMQALWPIAVILAVIGLVYVLTAPVMNWDGKPPDCNDVMVACPERKPPIICDNVQVACPKGG
jgi:hypothetical protein